jgi:16S rRNA (guanine966-N2)-methyltransferase
VREALFSILGDVQGLDVLDLFAGSGALGLEALSRGASSATFVEKARPALAALVANTKALAVEDRVTIVPGDAGAPVRGGSAYGLVFLDPPYDWPGVPALLAELVARGALVPGAWVVVEHASRDPAPAAIAPLEHRFDRIYGDTTLTFYRFAPEGS